MVRYVASLLLALALACPVAASVSSSMAAVRAQAELTLVQQQQRRRPAGRPWAPRWRGTKKKPNERPVTQTVFALFTIVGVVYTAVRTARRAHGE